jgi:serine/threonine-protein kinase
LSSSLVEISRGEGKRVPVTPSEEATPSKRQMGPYQLCLELGSGGMATVYLAKTRNATGIDRFVALKRLRRSMALDAAYVEMFIDEARIVSQIRHPNVCSLIDFDTDGEDHFLVMELIIGESLTALRRAMVRAKQQMPLRRRAGLIAKIVADACEGLHAAHELTDSEGRSLGVVHRDISPDNIFVTQDGVAKICDFGIARALDRRHRTKSGVLKGKFAYIAPELLRGKTADRRADVWGMGVVLWELLTKKRLFARSTEAETLRAVTEARIRPPSSVVSGLPAELDRIVAKALARDPRARYRTARELGRELTRFMAQHGQAIGLADVAEWMDEIFAGGRESKRQMLKLAAGLESTVQSLPSGAAVASTLTMCSSPTALWDAGSSGNPIATRSAWNRRSVRFGAVAGAVLLVTSVAYSALVPSRTESSSASREPPPLPAALPPPAAMPSAPAPPEPALPVVLPEGPYVLEIASPAASGHKPLVLRIRSDAESTVAPKKRVLRQYVAKPKAPPEPEPGPTPIETE